MKFLIWSNEHRGWWKPNRHGYTTLTHCAGQFSLEDATEIVTNANRYSEKIEDLMVPAPSREQLALDLAYPDR
jgi:hypothetical protein